MTGGVRVRRGEGGGEVGLGRRGLYSGAGTSQCTG